MVNEQVKSIATSWKAALFKHEATVGNAHDAADIVAHCINLMYPTIETRRDVVVLCENHRDAFVADLLTCLPNLSSLSGRGLAIYSASAFTRLLQIPKFNCAFVIRDTIGWNAAEELAIGSSKFYFKIHVVEAKVANPVTNLASPVEGAIAPVIALKPFKAAVPIAEVRYGLDLSQEDRDDYNAFSTYIEQTYAIFGSQRNMERAYMGDYKNGMSAEKVCTDIATSNGWSPNLDMTNTGDIFIDETYSPMALKERIKTTYVYGHERGKMLTDYYTKLQVIGDIVEQFQGGCLILNKSEEFCNTVVKSLNERFSSKVCLPFHDAIPSLTITGKNGKPKSYGARSQSKDNLNDFHIGRVWALCAKGGSLWKDIPFICRVVIITSPLACDFQTIAKRCPDSTFGNAKVLQLFKIFMNNTIEENVILRQSDAPDYEQIGGIKREITATENSAVFLTF